MGPAGPVGDRGPQGPIGATGPMGPMGATGSRGPRGVRGARGPMGPAGSDGTDGTNGTDGRSAYELWLADGNVGTLADFWSWLRSGAWGFGAFIDTTTQSNPVANVARPITFDTTLDADGVSISAGSKIVVDTTGLYNVQFSAEVTKSDSGIDYVDIWFVLNGDAIPWSNTRLTLSDKNDSVVAAWNYILTMSPTDELQLFWASADTSISIPSITGLTNPVRPDIPSLILTVYRMR